MSLHVASSGWTTTAIIINDGTSSDTWRFVDEINTATATHKEVAQSIVDWANDGGSRPWASDQFTWSELDFDPRVGIRLTTTLPTPTWVPNTAMEGMMSWPTSGTSANFDSTAGNTGTVFGDFAVRHWAPTILPDGGQSGVGSWFTDHQTHALVQPMVDSILTEGQVYALTLAVNAAPSPRLADVYHHAKETWRRVYMGQPSITRGQRQLYGVALDVVEVP